MRTISDEQIRSLKGATDASYRLGGGVSQFPLLTRVNVSTLSKYASFNDEHRECTIPVDVAVEADKRANSPVIVSAMAKVLGYRLVPDALVMEVSFEGVTVVDALKIASNAVGASQTIFAALEDGHIDALERKNILQELRETLRSVEQAIAKEAAQ